MAQSTQAVAEADTSEPQQPEMDKPKRTPEETKAYIQSVIDAANSDSFEKRWQEFRDRFDKVIQATIQSIGGDLGGVGGLAPIPEVSLEDRQAVFDGAAPTLELLAKRLKTCRNVVVMAGAGISCSAGIPDFRTPGTGLYDNLQAYDLPHPRAVFDLAFFRENSKPFNMLAKELYPGQFKPTTAHFLLRLLSEKGHLRRVYTQNIDGLERIAGVPADKLVEAHGGFDRAHCVGCGREHPVDDFKAAIFKEEGGGNGLVCECGSSVKPDIVFFGENLPQRFVDLRLEDLRECDCLIVMGTSLGVAPFNSLIALPGPSVPRLLINNTRVGEDIAGRFVFDGEEAYRDVLLLSDCDQGATDLAKLLGYSASLNALQGIKAPHKEGAGKASGATLPKPSPPTKRTSRDSPSIAAGGSGAAPVLVRNNSPRPSKPDSPPESKSASASKAAATKGVPQPTPAKVPAKATPTKAAPTPKAAPTKATPTKSVPPKATPTKATPTKSPASRVAGSPVATDGSTASRSAVASRA